MLIGTVVSFLCIFAFVVWFLCYSKTIECKVESVLEADEPEPDEESVRAAKTELISAIETALMPHPWHGSFVTNVELEGDSELVAARELQLEGFGTVHAANGRYVFQVARHF
jgi:Na+-transporting methylmalonyl-CoA/oxaloacetate decarboxylase gamma subunit